MKQQPSSWSAALVVGGNGALGSALISYLNDLRFTTIATTRHSTQNTNARYTIRANDLSEDSCRSLKADVDALVSTHNLHISFVFLVSGFGCHDDKCTSCVLEEMNQVNAKMPEWWCKNGPKDAIYVLFSSGAVYGTQGTIPLTHYSSTKRNAELLCRDTDAHLVIVRLAQVRTSFLERAQMSQQYSPLIAISSETAAYRIVNRIRHMHDPHHKTFMDTSIPSNGEARIILIGWATKLLHILNRISPNVAQCFLQI